MYYTVNQLAQLSGQTPRTIRHYDEIDLLKPCHIDPNGYRLYGAQEVDRLMQILYYRELSFPLQQIDSLLAGSLDPEAALQNLVIALTNQKTRLDQLIFTAEQAINYRKGGLKMNDTDKFVAFKQQLVQENEAQYGKEIRKKYGDQAVNRSNQQIFTMSEQSCQDIEACNAELNDTLKQATLQGDPASPLAQKACALHKQWLSFYWGFYDADTHLCVAESYVSDPRFHAYYEKIAPGCAEFLLQALTIYLA